MCRSLKRIKLMAVGQIKPWAMVGSMVTTILTTLELEQLSTPVRAANVSTSDSNRNVLFDQMLNSTQSMYFSNLYCHSIQKEYICVHPCLYFDNNWTKHFPLVDFVRGKNYMCIFSNNKFSYGLFDNNRLTNFPFISFNILLSLILQV